MATKHDPLISLGIILLLGIAVLIVLSSVCHAETYILTGADSTDKVFDTYIKGGHISYRLKNYGGSGYADVSWINSISDFYSYTLVGFDISGFPGSISEVDSAILSGVAYYVNTVWVEEGDTVEYDSMSVEVTQVLVQWGEGVGNGDPATSGECSYMDSTYPDDWNSEGCNGLNTDIDATPTGWQHLELDASGYHYIDTLNMDVTDDVKDMLVDPGEYWGWKISPVGFTPGENHNESMATFFTKESAEIHDENKWKLLIYYTPVAVASRRIKILKGGN